MEHHTERQSLHQTTCAQSQGNGRTGKEKDLLKIALQISKGKTEQEDEDLWRPDPMI